PGQTSQANVLSNWTQGDINQHGIDFAHKLSVQTFFAVFILFSDFQVTKTLPYGTYYIETDSV
ncbi:MAG: hypothetical protein ACYSU4_11210, partial [Planctomycetota bacterium]